MVSFNVDPLFVLDLRDDFIMNNTEKLYEFLDGDPVKAFHLGVHISKWFEVLDKNQMYLHAKSLRHNREDVEDYAEQIKYWIAAFPKDKDEEIDMVELSEFIFNKMIWDTGKDDKVKVALFLGMIVGKNSNLDEEQLIYNIH